MTKGLLFVGSVDRAWVYSVGYLHMPLSVQAAVKKYHILDSVKNRDSFSFSLEARSQRSRF